MNDPRAVPSGKGSIASSKALCAVILFVAAACGGSGAAGIAGPAAGIVREPDRETEWLAILIEGRKSGYVRSERAVGEAEVVTEVTTSMELRRGDQAIEMVSVSKTVETPDGRPLRFEKRTSGAGMEQTASGIVTSDGTLRITVESAGQVRTREAPWPEGALMSEGQRLESIARGLGEGVTYRSRYFDPDLLEAIDVELTVGAPAELDLLGRVVRGVRVTLAMEIRGAVSELTMYVDDDMNTLKTETTLMGMRTEMIACTRDYALSDNDPLELIRSTIVASPVPLSATARSGAISYSMRGRSGKAGPTLPATDEQAVERRGELTVVTVSPVPMPAGGTPPYRGDDGPARESLLSNEWIQSDAPGIAALAGEAAGEAASARDAALAIERFVGAYIERKDLSVGYATALEVSRSRKGDCTEHALLTAALCRAAGIPARVAFGLVYVEEYDGHRDVFGGHAWTQVFLGGTWVSLDSALGGFDAGHILIGTSDGNPADFFKAINVVGSFEIVAVKTQ